MESLVSSEDEPVDSIVRLCGGARKTDGVDDVIAQRCGTPGVGIAGWLH